MSWPTVAERFRANVDYETGPVHPTLGRCWLWTGAKNSAGFGQIRVTGRRVQAHILAAEWGFGMFWKYFGPEVHHRCGVRACVRPQHFRAATRKQNNEHPAVYRNSQSGVRGVYWDEFGQRWRAKLQHNGRGIHVGSFPGLPPPAEPPAEAVAAVIAKRNELFTHNDADRIESACLNVIRDVPRDN